MMLAVKHLSMHFLLLSVTAAWIQILPHRRNELHADAVVRSSMMMTKAATTSNVRSRDDAATTAVEILNKKREEPRPLHQNWWPVSTLYALDATRPNGVEVLSKKLVAFRDGEDSWKVLDDRCSHRFAPLSEGRLVQDDSGVCLQCAYHGWEFATNGTCTRLPQQPERVDKARPVQEYQTRVAAGMLWVWTDPQTVELAESIRLPIDPLLRRFVDKFGDTCCFMRDLPYGMEVSSTVNAAYFYRALLYGQNLMLASFRF